MKVELGLNYLLLYLIFYLVGMSIFFICHVDSPLSNTPFCDFGPLIITPLAAPGIIGMFFDENIWTTIFIVYPAIIIGLGIFFLIGFNNKLNRFANKKKIFLTVLVIYFIGMFLFFMYIRASINP